MLDRWMKIVSDDKTLGLPRKVIQQLIGTCLSVSLFLWQNKIDTRCIFYFSMRRFLVQ